MGEGWTFKGFSFVCGDENSDGSFKGSVEEVKVDSLSNVSFKCDIFLGVGLVAPKEFSYSDTCVNKIFSKNQSSNLKIISRDQEDIFGVQVYNVELLKGDIPCIFYVYIDSVEDVNNLEENINKALRMGKEEEIQ